MKKNSLIIGAILIVAISISGCSLIKDALADPIIGTWQQVSVNGDTPLLVNLVQFNEDNTYTVTPGIGLVESGTWSASGNSYTLTGSFLGFIGTTSVITPVFTSSNNTMTYTDEAGYAEVYNKI